MTSLIDCGVMNARRASCDVESGAPCRLSTLSVVNWSVVRPYRGDALGDAREQSLMKARDGVRDAGLGARRRLLDSDGAGSSAPRVTSPAGLRRVIRAPQARDDRRLRRSHRYFFFAKAGPKSGLTWQFSILPTHIESS